MISHVDAHVHRKQYNLQSSALAEHSLSTYMVALYFVEYSCAWVQKNK